MLLLTISLILLTILTYFANEKSLVSPAVLFSGGFTIASIIALFNEKTWNLHLESRTYFVIVLGVVEFTFVSYFINLLFRALNNKQIHSFKKIPDYVEKRFKFVLLIQIVTIFIAIFTLRRFTGISDLMSAINYINYVQNGFIQGQINLPKYFNFLLLFNNSVGFMAGYPFLEDIIISKKFNYILFFNVVLGLATPLLTGARGDSVVFLISLVILGYLISREYYKFNFRNTKYVILGFLGIILFIFIFHWSAALVGRNMEGSNLWDYISTYCGAEIANLNEFIKSRTFPIKGMVFGQQTFVSILPTLSRVFRFSLPQYKLDIPFQILNGHNTGNVATIFYSWLYDFGYLGVGILTLIMGIISELCYNFARKINGFSVIKLVYSYVGSLVALSFFSNRFFENLNVNFIYMIIFWVLLKFIMFRQEK